MEEELNVLGEDLNLDEIGANLSTELSANPSLYHPVGDVNTLLQVCKDLQSGNVDINGFEKKEIGIYRIAVGEQILWVNERWKDLILRCHDAGPIATANAQLYDIEPESNFVLLINKLASHTYVLYDAYPLYIGVWRIAILDVNSIRTGNTNYLYYNVPTKVLDDIWNIEDVRPEHIIPENSGSILVDEATSRFSGAIWYDAIREKNVTLAGVGGIGSYVGFMLSRMKPNQIIMYDPDIVETVNMSGQLYSKDDVGISKVVALSDMMHKYSNYYQNIAFTEKFDENSTATDIMICGFDNMKARSLFFDKWKKHVLSRETPEKCLFIDGRLAAEEFQVFAIQGGDRRAMDEYSHKWLFSDAEADETVCSYKQTTFMANMIASVIVNLFVNFVANECNPIIDRDIPFMTSYSADTMFFKVDM